VSALPELRLIVATLVRDAVSRGRQQRRDTEHRYDFNRLHDKPILCCVSRRAGPGGQARATRSRYVAIR